MVDVLIASICLKLNDIPDATKYYTSCINAMQAASIQTHIKPVVDDFEQKLNNDIKKQTGEAIWWIIGTGYAYQQKGLIVFNIGAKPVVDNIELKGSPNTGNVTLNWSW